MAEPCIDMILIMQNINKRESFLYPKSGCYKEWKDYIQKIDLQHCRFKRLYYCKLWILNLTLEIRMVLCKDVLCRSFEACLRIHISTSRKFRLVLQRKIVCKSCQNRNLFSIITSLNIIPVIRKLHKDFFCSWGIKKRLLHGHPSHTRSVIKKKRIWIIFR